MLGAISESYRDLRHATHFSEVDYPLIWVIIAVLAFGLVMVYSSSIVLADQKAQQQMLAAAQVAENGERPAELVTEKEPLSSWWSASSYLIRHAISIFLGVATASVIVLVPMRAWQKSASGLFIFGIVLLVLVLVPFIGHQVNGSRRWINLGITYFQPSELVKLFVVFYAADYTVRKAALMNRIREGFLPMALVMCITGLLLLQQPDFGAFFVIICIAFGILFLGGMNLKLFVGLFVMVTTSLALIVAFSPYRRDRIIGFMDPFKDEFGKGYQLSHSIF